MPNNRLKSAPNEIFTGLIKESDAYAKIDHLESLVESDEKFDLQVLPVQPAYLLLKSLSVEKVAELLPRFSKAQRELFLDVDLWVKDEIDLEHFPFWIMAYDQVKNDEVKNDFIQSEQFLLFLKSKFNIWTFDVEEPEYPDHDNYFLTEDSLLLFEFDKDYPFVAEVRDLIKHLYYMLGVENSYTFLFKLVSDSYLTLQEEEFRLRKSRLNDFGMVDYMDALELENPFIDLQHIERYIKSKKVHSVEVAPFQKNQVISNQALMSFKDQFKSVLEELGKVTDLKRMDFIQFNFIRLLNGRLEYSDAFKRGSVAMQRTGHQTKALVMLGLSYLKTKGEESVFDRFDFSELYRIGNSLVLFNRKKIKKSLTQFHFENDKEEAFLGEYWSDFLDESFQSPAKFTYPNSDKADLINDYEIYKLWLYKTDTFIGLLPFAQKFYETYSELKKNQKILDIYYLNYAIEDLDFESLLMTSFANFFINSSLQVSGPKLGLTLSEYKDFASKFVNAHGVFEIRQAHFTKIDEFIKTFGLESVYDFNQYFQSILKNALSGYDFSELNEEDFKHVGGPIILNTNRNDLN